MIIRPVHRLRLLLALALLLVGTPNGEILAFSAEHTKSRVVPLAPSAATPQSENVNENVQSEDDTPIAALPANGMPSRRLMPTAGTTGSGEVRAAATSYDPTSVYDQKGSNAPRGFSSQAPTELIDPFSGNLILRHVDLTLPGVAGLDLVLQRVYNSKIHRNYAARITGDAGRVQAGMLFVPPSPLGLGWNLHLGRIVGGAHDGPNDLLSSSRYYEAPDGSQHSFFTYSGSGCGDGSSDICLMTKGFDNPYQLVANGPWYIATAEGLNITFSHSAVDSDGLTPVHYATEIRDVHGNRIQISYHDNTIDGIGVQREYFRHFIDTIIDSAGRQISFHYTVVNSPDVVRLTSITAVGRTYTFAYANSTPWAPNYAFLTSAQPPEGAPWRYTYAGLNNGDCADNGKRWCELTGLTYPAGGTIDYTYDDLVFSAQTNLMSVRAVSEREIGGRAISDATWSYQYNRAANYSGSEHTVITRPDGSEELYTYFGVGDSAYNPLGQAWKAGALLQTRIREDGNIVETESYEWIASPAISAENWGDPWIGFDNGVFIPRLQEHTIQRGSLTWTTTHTSFNDANNTPRCTTEQGPEGSAADRRYRLQTYTLLNAQQGDYLFTWMKLPETSGLSYDAFSATQCNPQQSGSWTPQAGDEALYQQYNADGQLLAKDENGIITDYEYHGDGSTQAELTYQGANRANGYCTVYSDYQYGVARTTTYGAAAPACTGGIYSAQRTLYPDGSIQEETNGRGDSTAFEYDGLGRRTRIEPPGDAAIVITYDGSATSFNTERRVEQGAYWVEYHFDGFGRELEQESSGGTHTRQSYDALNRITFRSLPSSNSGSNVGDTFTHDALGRLTSATHADGSDVRFDYGTSQQTLTITDEENRETLQRLRSFAHPDEYWLVRVQRPGEAVPSSDTYSYLVGGHLTSISYAGSERILDYNFAKQVIYEQNPESGARYFGYDAAGNLRCRSRSANCSDTNANNPAAQVRYTVDRLNRITQILYNDGRMLTLTYDNANNLETMTDDVGFHEFDYTPANRLEERTSTIHNVTYVTGYGYDNRGNLETLTYPSGRVVTYGYNAANQIESVRDGNGFYVTNIDYHPNGMSSSATFANGIVTTLSLDNRQRPDQLRASGVVELNYDYDAVGNLNSLTDGIDANQSMTFDYDDLDRLTDASGGWGTLHYEYYDNGDRRLERLNGQETLYTYDSQGLLQSLSGRINLSYGYDSFGNVTQRGNFTYGYDAEEHLTTVTGPANITYAYDGQGRRMLATREGCATSLVYHYDQQGNRIAESTESGLILKEYIVTNEHTVAELDLRPLRAGPAEIDFGGVEIRTAMTHTVELTNRTSQPLTLNTLAVQSPFFLQANLPLEISAHGTVMLPIRFAPFQRQSYQGNLTACESNGVSLDVELRGRGLAAEAVLILPEYNLGDVALGAVVERTLVVSNTGDAPLRVTGWTVSDPALAITPPSALTVQPGATQELTLAFDSLKTKCDGLYSGSLELESNSISPAEVLIRANVRGMEVVAGELNFGPLDSGASRTLKATLINRATLPLTPTVILAGAPQFRLGAYPTGLVAPGDSVEVEVIYRPVPVLWSPFGDHASLASARPGCESTCTARVHLIGNIGAEAVPGADVSPALAIAGNSPQLASVANGVANGIVFHVRDGNGAWSQGTSAGAASASQPRLLAGPGGSLTALWHDSATPTLLTLSRRIGSGDWGAICSQAGKQNGGAPLAYDTNGNLWLGWTEADTGISLAGPILSAAAACQAGQMPVTATLGIMDTINLVNGADGRLRVAAADSIDGRLYLGTLDPANGEVDFTYNFAASVNPGAAPVQAIAPNGSWHVAWPGDAEFYEHLNLEGTDQALYAYAHANTRFVEVVPLMRESSQADGMQIDVDSLNNVHIAWSDQACAPPGQRKLYYVNGRPSIFYGGWQAIDVTTPGYTGADPSLAMTIDDDRLMAAWGISGGNNAQLLFGEAGVGSRAATNVVSATITPEQGGTLVVPDGTVVVEFPAGAVTEPATVTYSRRPQPVPALGNLLFAGHSFALEARDTNNMLISSFVQSYTITLNYSEEDWQQSVGDENSLNLYYWDGTRWKGVLPCAGCSLDTINNVLVAVLDHMTEFALLGGEGGQRTHLPKIGAE